MKHYNPLLLIAIAAIALSACSPLQTAINPYEEDFKCKARNNEGECVDTPTAYKNARYPEATPDKLNPESIPSQEIKITGTKSLPIFYRNRKSHSCNHQKYSESSCFPTKERMTSCS